MLISVIVDDNVTWTRFPRTSAQQARRRQRRRRSPSRSRPRCSTPASTGIIFNMPVYTPGAIAAVGEALKPVLPT